MLDVGENHNAAPGEGGGPIVRKVVRQLVGGEQNLSMRQVADLVDRPVPIIKAFWRAMGFADVDPGEAAFADMDRKALDLGLEALDAGTVDAATGISLLRAQSHMTDRLVLWQFEALVDDVVRRLELDDTAARLLVLERIGPMIDVMEQQLVYSWRRQMASLIVRTEAEVAHRGKESASPNAYPLSRSLGFVDMVAYTRRSSVLGPHALTQLVQTFDQTARDVITSRGARVVKTIGDAVLYIADDLPTAAEVACSLIEELQQAPELLPVRASLVRGRVVSRSGDVFGPTVNLASRLVDIAPEGEIFTDEDTARGLIAESEGKFSANSADAAVLRGVGTVVPFLIHRSEEFS